MQTELTAIDNDIVDEFLAHHGIKGQKWGNRKYQYNDGSLTPLGRVHYGVDKARDSIGNAASKAGTSIRKKVKPTDDELRERLNKAQAKHDRQEMKAKIKELEGKPKKLKDMSDQEVLDRYNRLQREAAIKRMEKEARQTRVGKFIEDNAKQGLNRAMNSVIEDSVKNLFKKEEKKPYTQLLKEKYAEQEYKDVMEGKRTYKDKENAKKGNKKNSNNDDNKEEPKDKEQAVRARILSVRDL